MAADTERPYNAYTAGTRRKELMHPMYMWDTMQALALPELIWSEFLAEEVTDSQTVMYHMETTLGGNTTRGNADTDPRKRLAPLRAEGTQFAQAEVSEMGLNFAKLRTQGVEIKFQENIRKSNVFDPIRRTRDRVAFWIAQQLNNEPVVALFNNWTFTNDNTMAAANRFANITSDPTLARGAGYTTGGTYPGIVAGILDVNRYWGSATMRPILDLQDLYYSILDQNGYNYHVDYIMVPTKMFKFLKQYCDATGTNWELTPFEGAKTGAKRSAMTIPDVGECKIVETRYVDGLNDNVIVAFDSSVDPGTIFKSFDNEWEQFGIQYDAEKDFLMTHYFRDDHNHDDFYQYWWTRAITVNEPAACGFLQVAA